MGSHYAWSIPLDKFLSGIKNVRNVRKYDVIAFGTGSAMNVVSPLLGVKPDVKVAVIENGPVGGICLTRGCIPSKMLLYPAELVREIMRAKKFGIDVELKGIGFPLIMNRIVRRVKKESETIERSLISHPSIDLYKRTGKFVGDYTVEVGGEQIRGEKILLCTGSRPTIPLVEGLEDVGYITSDTFFGLKELPRSVVVIGGGFVGTELGFFLSMMGANVMLVEKNPRIVPVEEPEISELLGRELSRSIKVMPNRKAVEARKIGEKKVLVVENSVTGRTEEIAVDEILVASGRRPNSDITEPEKTGVEVDDEGWITVNEYLETTKENIWSCGDATGKHMFKHVANYESQLVFYNAFTGKRIKADYHAVPHAIFTYPEVASVGLKEGEIRGHDILIGYYKYEDTTKGEAMALEDYFVKVIVEKGTYRILGAHIIGPQASILIQEVVNLMYTNDQSMIPIYRGMHIHPALSEVIERAFFNLREPEAQRDYIY